MRSAVSLEKRRFDSHQAVIFLVVQTFDPPTQLLLGLFTFQVASSESSASFTWTLFTEKIAQPLRTQLDRDCLIRL
jgi:hypothetical protein